MDLQIVWPYASDRQCFESCLEAYWQPLEYLKEQQHYMSIMRNAKTACATAFWTSCQFLACFKDKPIHSFVQYSPGAVGYSNLSGNWPKAWITMSKDSQFRNGCNWCTRWIGAKVRQPVLARGYIVPLGHIEWCDISHRSQDEHF